MSASPSYFHSQINIPQFHKIYYSINCLFTRLYKILQNYVYYLQALHINPDCYAYSLIFAP